MHRNGCEAGTTEETSSLASPNFTTPDWVYQAIFYQIFPDRFASSRNVHKPNNLEAWDSPPTTHGFKGGDLLGVLERLDYLQDLGITAIYFNPIFQSTANHRYHTHNYFQVDPILGGNTAFRRLLDEAHRRNMRIILDGVFNHTGRGFFQFNHILENGSASPYCDWFRVRRYPLNAYGDNPNYDCWHNLQALPELNYSNPDVRSFIYSVASYWLEQGVDGWRLDAPFLIDDDDFWRGFRELVKRVNPEAYITAEIGDDASRWLQGDQFDTVMNYELAYACWGFFGGDALDRELLGHWLRHADQYLNSNASSFSRHIEELLTKYPRQSVLSQLNLLDSHDTPRLLTILGGDKRLLRLAILFQMTYPGAPCIYYGDEIGLEGGSDPDCRRSFCWEEDNWDHDLLAFFKQCITLRHTYRALREGEFRTIYAQGGVFIYSRRLNDEHLVVVLNHSPSALHLNVPVHGLLADGRVLYGRLMPGNAAVVNGHLTGLMLPPECGTVLSQDREGCASMV